MDALFVHVPKAGGTSIRQWLLENLPGPLLHIHHKHAKFDYGAKQVTCLTGTKHGDLFMAEPLVQMFTGKTIAQLPLVIAAVRNPYDREVAWFSYLERSLPIAGHIDDGRWGSFEEFVQRPSTRDRNLENFYLLNDLSPPGLRIVRTEHLEEDLTAALRVIGAEAKGPVPRLNQSRHGAWRNYYTPAIEAAVFDRYRWYFDRGLYPRLAFPAEADASLASFGQGEALISGPVRLSGLMRGLGAGSRSGADLVFTVMPHADIESIELRCAATAAEASDYVLMASVGGRRSARCFAGNAPVVWKLPCPAKAGQRVQIAFQASRLEPEGQPGGSPPRPRLGLAIDGIAFA
jgi:hypothetical protein